MRQLPDAHAITLLDVPPGGRARVVDFNGMPDSQREKLQAYGLTPGSWVRVIQHAPVTVIQVENTELALEADLAGLVAVEWHAAGRPGPRRGGGWRRRRRRFRRQKPAQGGSS